MLNLGLTIITIGLFLWLGLPESKEVLNPNAVSPVSSSKYSKKETLRLTPTVKPTFKYHSFAITDTALNLVNTGQTEPYNGEDFILTLTNEEMGKLGFYVDEEGIFFNNKFEGKIQNLHCQWDEYGEANAYIFQSENKKNKKKDYSSFDFYPITLSNTSYTSYNFSAAIFKFMNDTLLPIKLKKEKTKRPNQEILVWFKITDDLLERLPARFMNLKTIYQKVIIEKRGNPELDLIQYQPISIVTGIHLIELTKRELQKIGFEVTDSTFTFKLKWDNYNTIGLGYLNKGNLAAVQKDSLFNEKIKFGYLTNIYGEHTVRIHNKLDSFKYIPEVFQKKIQFLVPILIKQSDYPSILREDQIYWFEPTESLFDALPSRIGNQLRKEYKLITSGENDTKSASKQEFTYFENPNTTFDLKKISVSLNPAIGKALLEFTLGAPIKGSISLVNINGAFEKQLEFSTLFKQGANTFNFDVSDVNPGIYLIVINTAKGYATQRLAVSH